MRGGRIDDIPLIGAAVAVGCCAGLPLIASVLGGLTIAAVIGVAGGALLAAAALAIGVLVLRARRHRNCAAPARKASP